MAPAPDDYDPRKAEAVGRAWAARKGKRPHPSPFDGRWVWYSATEPGPEGASDPAAHRLPDAVFAALRPDPEFANVVSPPDVFCDRWLSVAGYHSTEAGAYAAVGAAIMTLVKLTSVFFEDNVVAKPTGPQPQTTKTLTAPESRAAEKAALTARLDAIWEEERAEQVAADTARRRLLRKHQAVILALVGDHGPKCGGDGKLTDPDRCDYCAVLDAGRPAADTGEWPGTLDVRIQVIRD